jgi:hypothetical protein
MGRSSWGTAMSMSVGNDGPKNQWGRKWLLRGARFSLLVGLLAGGKQAWDDFSDYQEDVRRTVTSQLGYECAARLADDILTPNQNDVGNINVRKFGCATDDFYVSMKEIQDVRSGAMRFVPFKKAFYPISVLIASILGVVATLLLTAVAVVSLKALHWAWGR